MYIFTGLDVKNCDVAIIFGCLPSLIQLIQIKGTYSNLFIYILLLLLLVVAV